VRVTSTGNSNGVIAGTGTTIRLIGVVVTGNAANGISPFGGGAVLSPNHNTGVPGINVIAGNASNGAPTGDLPTQ
jgi:hypothetical protein